MQVEPIFIILPHMGFVKILLFYKHPLDNQQDFLAKERTQLETIYSINQLS